MLQEIIAGKISKLLSQLEEAENLKSFRNRRGERIFNALSSYLSEGKAWEKIVRGQDEYKIFREAASSEAGAGDEGQPEV